MGLGIDSDPASQTVDPPIQAVPTFIDGSDLLFSMYNKTTAEHDRKAAENWRSDADSAVFVVRRHFPLPRGYRCAQFVEWSIFSYSCYSTREVIPGLEARSAGCLGFLSFSDLSVIGWH